MMKGALGENPVRFFFAFTRNLDLKNVLSCMKNLPPYHPISCDFHSELELLALRQTPCPIIFRHEDGTEETVQSRIADLLTRDGEEFLILPDARQIRLDRLVSVNGLKLAAFC